MREPAFWWRKGGGSLLAPFAAIYGAVAWGRIQAQGKPAGVPVICLGNLTAGGAEPDRLDRILPAVFDQ